MDTAPLNGAAEDVPSEVGDVSLHHLIADVGPVADSKSLDYAQNASHIQDASSQSCGLVVNELLCSLQFCSAKQIDKDKLHSSFFKYFSMAEVEQAHLVLDSVYGPQMQDSEQPNEGQDLAALASRLYCLVADEQVCCSFVAQDLSRVVRPSDFMKEEGRKDETNVFEGRLQPAQRKFGSGVRGRKRGRPRSVPVQQEASREKVPQPFKVSLRGRKRKLTSKMAAQEETLQLIKHEVESDSEQKPEQQQLQQDGVARRGRPRGSVGGKRGRRRAEAESYLKHGMLDPETGLYKCNQCGKSFELCVTLKRHWLTHEARKRNVCSVCSKSFTSTGGLRDHMLIHSGEKPHQCSECGARFRLRCDWERHQRTHTKARPYMCHVCGKCFSTSNVLAIHRRTHTGETPYSCQFCGQMFIRLTALKNHEHIHTGERPYKCKICGKSYGNGGTYWHHQQLHKKEEQQQQMLRAPTLVPSGGSQLQFDTMVAVAEMVAGTSPHQLVLTEGALPAGVIGEAENTQLEEVKPLVEMVITDQPQQQYQ